MPRRTAEDFEAVGVQQLVDALGAADIAVSCVARREGPLDALVGAVVDDRPVMLAVEVKAYCTGDAAWALTNGWAAGRREDAAAPVSPVVVAERITSDARGILSDAGWSWLDLRGRLHLRARGVRVETDVPAAAGGPAVGPPGPAIRGRGGITVAYWLCAHPGESLSPNRDSATLGVAPSTISTAVNRLSRASLVDHQGCGLFPELFWELAEAWKVQRTWVATRPEPSTHLPADPLAPTWRRSGTAAAVAYGAPVVSVPGGAVDLYVLGPVEVAINVGRYGASQAGVGAATLAVAPTTLVVRRSEGEEVVDVEGWPAAPLLVVALDLAQDRSRGREILRSWERDGDVWRD